LEANKEIVRRFNQEVWSEGSLDAVDAIVAADLVWHNAAIDGAAAFKQNLIEFRAAFPDAHTTTEELLAEGDKVVARMAIQGTWAATGQQATWTATGIFRIAEGQIVEMWTDEDRLSRLEQLGFTVVRRPAA
jgi:predicted ester cyclase